MERQRGSSETLVSSIPAAVMTPICFLVQVLQAADVVVASNDDGGIAEAFERFVL